MASFNLKYRPNSFSEFIGNEATINGLLTVNATNNSYIKCGPNENGYFEVKLPRSEVMVKLKPLSYGEILEIAKMVESYPANMIAPRVTWRLMKQIIEINGESDREKVSQMISNLPIMDSKFIKNFINENEPSLDLKRTVRAPSGDLVNFDITFGVDFFRPFF
jgi:hypothetical protein